ncbi:hypothetical protein [Pseudogracilibacillus sp. SO30301A]|uniref:hypothetical protein n=1 Tax=Pseudogracilibacillus sp. SO30301A TaxID=3098291 RepID=UPI00300DD574
MNRQKIEQRVKQCATELVIDKGYVSPIDLFLQIGWFTDDKVNQWRFRKIPHLECAATSNLSKLNFALKTLRKVAIDQNWKESTTVYYSWGKGAKRKLIFSKSRNPYLEKLYATHYVLRQK